MRLIALAIIRQVYFTVLLMNVNSIAEYGSVSLFTCTVELNYSDCPVSQRTDDK
jgi:hypothetical protein